jgi:hypothetical protein
MLDRRPAYTLAIPPWAMGQITSYRPTLLRPKAGGGAEMAVSVLSFDISFCIDLLFKILSYFTRDTCKNKMIRIKQLLFLCFFSSIAVAIGCTIDFSLNDGGTDSGSDSDSDTDTDAGTCTGANESAFGNHCYRSVSSLANFNTAESSCVAWGGHLASVSSEQEKNYILAIISDVIWIGLHFSVDSFVYTDGSPLIYDNWARNEPRGGENCVQMTNLTPGEWSDEPCSNELGFVCKRPL